MDETLHEIHQLAPSDTNRMIALMNLAERCMGKDQRQIGEDPGRTPALLDEVKSAASRFGHRSIYAGAQLMYGRYYTAKGSFDSALSCLGEALDVYRSLNDEKGTAYSMLHLGLCCRLSGKQAEALSWAKKSLALYEKIGKPTRIAETMNLVGAIYFELDMLDSAAIYYERVLRASEQLGYRPLMASTLINLGQVFQSLGYVQGGDAKAKALLYFRRAESLCEEIGWKGGTATALYSIGNLSLETGRIDEGLAAHSRALKIAEDIHDAVMMCLVHNALGLVASQMNDCGTARKEFLLSIAVAEKGGNETDLSMPLIGLGRLYLNCVENPDSAIMYGKRALDIALKTGDKDGRMKVNAFLSEAYAAAGHYDVALEYHRQAATLKDEIYSERSAKTIAELTARYDADKREDAIRLLEQDARLKDLQLQQRTAEMESAKQRNILLSRDKEIRDLEFRNAASLLERRQSEIARNRKDLALAEKDRQLQAAAFEYQKSLRNTAIGGLAAALLVVFLVSLLVAHRLREKRREAALKAEAAELRAGAAEAQSLALLAETERKEKEAQKHFSKKLLDSQEEERKRIAAELHDSLGQEILVIGNQANLSLLDEPDAAAREGFVKIAAMAKQALDDVRVISRNLRPLQLERSGLAETIRDTVHQAARSSGIRFSADIGDIDGLFSSEDRINVYRIVQEALNNVLKHSGATEAAVRAAREDGGVRLTITDNGQGFDPGASRHEDPMRLGFGLQGMGEWARMLGGALTIQSRPGKGTTLDILFPVHPPQPVMNEVCSTERES
ncbi:MAG: tetratricopeptide repeat protein [Bacteroidota bacterium]|nr:tetratricopeptide repeat protein [Bacteroidota bacterium]